MLDHCVHHQISHLLYIRDHPYCNNYIPIYMSMTTANRTHTNVNVSFVFSCFDILNNTDQWLCY